MLLTGAALCIALVAMLSSSAHADVALEARKLPMKFSWAACHPNCGGLGQRGRRRNCRYSRRFR